MPNQKNKFLKKMVLLFFEMVPKVDSEGKLLQEMILLWYHISKCFNGSDNPSLSLVMR